MQVLKSTFRFYPERCRVLSGGECRRLKLENLGSVPSPVMDVLCGLWQADLTSISQFIVFSSFKCCAVWCRASARGCLLSAVREYEGGRRWLPQGDSWGLVMRDGLRPSCHRHLPAMGLGISTGSQCSRPLLEMKGFMEFRGFGERTQQRISQ